jgi:signal transduction histidine kinase
MINKSKKPSFFEIRPFVLVTIIIAIAVFVFTWISIKENRSDSYSILVAQGEGFIEALTIASENAIAAESFYDYLTHRRFHEITINLSDLKLDEISNDFLNRLIFNHDLDAIYVFNVDSTLLKSEVTGNSLVELPDYVYDELTQLIAEPITNYRLILDQGDETEETVHYYIEITNRMDRVIVIVADADYYIDALEQTQIGYLSQKLAREEGVEYILYQTTEGIVFSSRKPGELLSIESDPFLIDALDANSVMNRRYEFLNREVLELVRPFSTHEYPYGLLRLGLSLENYNTISLGYDRQMIGLSIVLFAFVLIMMLYQRSRRHRREISQEYHKIKSISDNIFEKMKTGVVALDIGGNVILVNDAFEQIFEQKFESGQSWSELKLTSELEFDSMINSPLISFEKEISLTNNRETRQILVAVSKILNDEKQPEGLVIVVYNVTQLKELEQRTARRERLSELGNLAAGVAHEIRNPLNTISIASQRLASEFQTEENQDEYLKFTSQIKSETKRLNEIITKFLALTREGNNTKEKIELHDIINDFTSLTKFEADKLGLSLETDIERNLVIEFNSDNLKQILINLFNNSKEAFAGVKGEIRVSAYKKNNKTYLTFEDSGPGISEDNIEKIFTPYFTTKEAGTGLGLPTIYRIITEAGGEIQVSQSKLGGAMFEIIF